jgi:hypothetical protein
VVSFVENLGGDEVQEKYLLEDVASRGDLRLRDTWHQEVNTLAFTTLV